MPAADWHDGWAASTLQVARKSTRLKPAALQLRQSILLLRYHSTTSFDQRLKRFVIMADTNPLANAQQQRMSTNLQMVSPPAEDVVPLFDIIDSCLEELPALREIMPSRHATACLMSGAGQESVEDSSGYSIMMRRCIDRFVQKGHAVLIIGDINAEWYHALAARFPKSLDVRFLAQHVLRQGELRAIYDSPESLRDGYKTLVDRVDAEISRRLSGTTVHRDHRSRHIDGQISRSIVNAGPVHRTTPAANGYRKEVLRK